MSSPRLRTDWQLGCMELKQRGTHLLQSGQWSDCTFLVGSDLNRVTVKAHKLILACASPVFEAMFYGGMAEKDGPIEILDVQPEALITLLQYIYTDKAIINSFDKACSVYYGAKKYMLPYLEKECTWYISLNLNPQNVCRAYELAQLFDQKLLKEKCEKIFVTRTKEIINDENFEDIEMATLLTLLSQNELCIDSELDLFRAIEKYANIHTCMKRGLDNSLDIIQEHSPSKKVRRDSLDMREALVNMFGDPEESQETEVSQSEVKDCEVSQSQLKDCETVQDSQIKVTEQQAGPACPEKDNQKNNFDVNNNNSEVNTSESLIDRSFAASARTSLRAAIGHIRFLTLTAQQFAGGPARSPLLTESEAFAVLMNILSSQAPVPMPHGFSTCRLSRNHQIVSQEEPDSKPEVVFRFTVLNFKTRRRSVESRAFSFLHLDWIVKLVPRFETDTSGIEHKYLGVFLKCLGRSDHSSGAYSERVHARVRLVPHDAGRAPVAADLRRTFHTTDNMWGFDRLVTWSDATDPSRGLLKGNALVIEMHLVSE